MRQPVRSPAGVCTVASACSMSWAP